MGDQIGFHGVPTTRIPQSLFDRGAASWGPDHRDSALSLESGRMRATRTEPRGLIAA